MNVVKKQWTVVLETRRVYSAFECIRIVWVIQTDKEQSKKGRQYIHTNIKSCKPTRDLLIIVDLRERGQIGP